MDIESVKSFDGPIASAFEVAHAEAQPLVVAADVYADDRGWSIMNQLQGVMTKDGQINYSVMYPGIVKAWHRHQKQTDFWLCLRGHLKAGICSDDGRAWQTVLGEMRPGVLIIPPPLWHGCATVGSDSAGLMYYVTHAYDPKSPDEDRRPHDSFDGFPWSVQHR